MNKKTCTNTFVNAFAMVHRWRTNNAKNGNKHLNIHIYYNQLTLPWYFCMHLFFLSSTSKWPFSPPPKNKKHNNKKEANFFLCCFSVYFVVVFKNHSKLNVLVYIHTKYFVSNYLIWRMRYYTKMYVTQSVTPTNSQYTIQMWGGVEL